MTTPTSKIRSHFSGRKKKPYPMHSERIRGTMPSASHRYKVVGFSPGLDWIPVTFLSPIPANRVCSVCGLVRKRTASLPCTHVLCESCYKQCERGCFHVCPFDDCTYEEDDATITNFSADELLRMRVKCWNEPSGCQHTTSASGIVHHFLRQCEYHSVPCPKCSDPVLCKELCAHLRSCSCNASMPLASKKRGAPPGHVDEAASLTSLRGAFERQAHEIKAHLRPAAVDIPTHGDKSNEISDGINILRETLVRELGLLTRQIQEAFMKNVRNIASSNTELKECFAACNDTLNICLENITTVQYTVEDNFNGTRDQLSQIAGSIEEVKAELSESAEAAMESVPIVPIDSLIQVTQCEFLVKGVAALRSTVIEKSRADYDFEMVYIRGYCMTPGIRLDKAVLFPTLQGKYTLHKGAMDDVVQWPFQHKLRMNFIHPEWLAERVLEIKPSQPNVANQRPVGSSNPPYYSFSSLNFEQLATDGYVFNDQLVIKLDMLS